MVQIRAGEMVGGSRVVLEMVGGASVGGEIVGGSSVA